MRPLRTSKNACTRMYERSCVSTTLLLPLSDVLLYVDIECPNAADWTVCNAALRTPCALLSAQNLVFKVRVYAPNRRVIDRPQLVFTCVINLHFVCCVYDNACMRKHLCRSSVCAFFSS